MAPASVLCISSAAFTPLLLLSLLGGVVSLWRPKGLWDAGVSEGCGAWGSWPPRPPRGSFTAAHLPRSFGAGQWRGAGPPDGSEPGWLC